MGVLGWILQKGSKIVWAHGWALEWAFQGSGHTTKAVRVHEVFAQWSQACGVILGAVLSRAAVGL